MFTWITRLEGFCQSTGLPMYGLCGEANPFHAVGIGGPASAQDYAPGRAAEGIVIRPVEEARSLILESGRLSAKVISERYALKHGE
jgi:hypothetical protein